MAAPALRLVDDVEEHVPVPAGLLASAIDNAAHLADDLLAAIGAAEQRLFVGSRAGALNELGRMALRVESLRDAFTALDPTPHRPGRPTRVA